MGNVKYVVASIEEGLRGTAKETLPKTFGNFLEMFLTEIDINYYFVTKIVLHHKCSKIWFFIDFLRAAASQNKLCLQKNIRVPLKNLVL